MSKILKSWAGEEALMKFAVLNVGTPWYDIETGERQGYAEWKPAVMQETGGDFLLAKHEDVHRLLYDLAVKAGAEIIFGAQVAGVTPSEEMPSITLANGETHRADVIIAADGPNSFIRGMILEGEESPRPEGHTIFGGIIPAADMQDDEEFKSLVGSPEWPIFMGNNRSMNVHPVSAHKEFSLQIYWPNDDVAPEANPTDDWFEVVTTDAINLDSCGPNASNRVRRLIEKCPRLAKCRYMRWPSQIEYWSDVPGRIVLVGESAHPWMPGGTQAACMALEDAAVFAALFSRLQNTKQIGAFVGAYQELREDRVASVKDIDISNALMCWLPPGPDRDARNADFRQSRSEWDEGILQREFEGISSLFGYEALDATEEWWVNWGRFNLKESGETEKIDYGLGTMALDGVKVGA